MRVSQKIATTVAVAAVIIVGATYVGLQKSETAPAVQSVSTQASVDVVRYQGEDGKTALELLKQYKPSTMTKSSSLGEYVVSIEGNDGGGTKYWLFYVNGKQASEGAGTYVTKTGDAIEWKLQ